MERVKTIKYNANREESIETLTHILSLQDDIILRNMFYFI